MGRFVQFDTDYNVTPGTASGIQDLVELKLSASQAGFIHSVIVMQSSDEDASPTTEELRINCKRATGAYTAGSGGGTLTNFITTNGAAHQLTTANRNNGTQAVAGGGALANIPIMCGVFNVNAGEWERTPTPEMRVPIGPSEAFIVSLDEAVTDAITMRCVVVLELTHG